MANEKANKVTFEQEAKIYEEKALAEIKKISGDGSEEPPDIACILQSGRRAIYMARQELASRVEVAEYDAVVEKLENLLCHATGGKYSKAGYSWEDMERMVTDYIEECCEEAVADGVVHARWEDGKCTNCGEEALATSWDEPIYDYDWEENLRYSHTETHTEYYLTDYCPNCGAKMDGERKDNGN